VKHSVYLRPWWSADISTMAYIAPLLELAQNEMVQSKIEEAGKLFFSSDTVTVNLIPVLVGAALLGLLLIPLFALLFQPAAETTGYGPPVSEYGAPSAGYGAPEYRSGQGYEEFRSLFTNLLDSTDTSQSELTKRMQDLAGPTLSSLTNAATKLIQ